MTTLLSLPAELRLRIFSYTLQSVDIYTVPGSPMKSPKRIPGLRAEFNLEPIGEDEWSIHDYPPPPMHRLNTFPPTLLVNKQIHDEISGLPWESHVGFVFPSTVAMLDVLLTWPQERIERVRRIKLYGTPLPLYPINDDSCYHTHGSDSGLALLKGLQLDILEYEDAYLPCDDGWGRGQVTYELKNLIKSTGWKELHYLARQPYLQEREVEALVNIGNLLREERNEPGFIFDLPSTPVKRDKNGIIEALKQTEEWTGQYGANIDGSHADGELWMTPVDVVMTVKRDRSADYVQRDFGVGMTGILRWLLERMTWQQLRESGDYLVDDGTDDPCGHL